MVEYYDVTQPGGPGSALHIEGFPQAVKLGALRGPKAKRLAHLALHLTDLSFAGECLDALASVHDEPIRSALWHAAIVHYMKCSGRSKGRFQLQPRSIYAAESPAMVAFRFFKDMRNKHFVHDENAFSQALPGAIINDVGAPLKIAKIITLAARGDILGQENSTNLRLLIVEARRWVVQEHDALCDSLSKDLESKTYQDLLALPDLVYRKPVAEDAAVERRQE